MERQPLPAMHITQESHPHEVDYFAFVDADGRVKSLVLETHRVYHVGYTGEPVKYLRGDVAVYVREVQGTYVGMDLFENAHVTFCDVEGNITEQAERTDFRFLYREGDEISEIVSEQIDTAAK